MRICSLVPGATEVVAALDLTDKLVAVSHECDYPESVRHITSVVESVIERNTLSYVLDANAYFSRPGPRLVDGVELPSTIFHPRPAHYLNPAQAVRLSASMLSVESRS
jgi:hypothetical protein